jgi:hypothetical protein
MLFQACSDLFSAPCAIACAAAGFAVFWLGIRSLPIFLGLPQGSSVTTLRSSGLPPT